MDEYLILHAKIPVELSIQVNKHIKEYGYIPQGGVSYFEFHNWYVQAMTKIW